ncbi:hypothetical protein BM51_2238 [Streptococcus pneumoniae]|nr:hypothetical protein BM50_2225 [Streptococcus pneumoniae]KGI29703.1 hypothetical protein BM51_2238 [Streptococcus pneumoniae]KGI29831.1 hypothetical protein BM48_2220 [Streptococcus pneumoniae]CIW20350.1 Uncharacterised protein [Streptococcus pneumoniae]
MNLLITIILKEDLSVMADMFALYLNQKLDLYLSILDK